MESKYASVANTILHHANAATNGTNNTSGSKQRFIVAIAGIPGSGKTTTAKAVVRYLNDNSSTSRRTAILSMDGFHLPRATLDKLPNRDEAYTRRGAPWTFDVDRFLGFMKRLRTWADSTEMPTLPTTAEEPTTVSTVGTNGTYQQPSTTKSTSESESSSSTPKTKENENQGTNVIYAPTFDHSTKDPIENDLKITPDVSIIIIEGNYLLLDEPGWRDIAKLTDYKVFVDTDPEEARERVAKRHVQAGIEKTLDDGLKRANGNDYLNGILIKEKLIPADLVIQSHGTGK